VGKELDQMPKQQDAECPICGGTGWKNVGSSGKTSQVTRCDCRADDRKIRLRQAARIPSRYDHCTLSDFQVDFEGAHPSLTKALLAAGRFVEDYPLENVGLWFSGPIGVGKTHLAVGIILQLVQSKGVQCLFCDYRELLKEIQNSYNPSVQSTELEILRPVFDAEVLVLDELGAIKPSDWVFDTVGYILNYRYNQKKTTVITTNFVNAPARGVQEVTNHSTNAERAKSAARGETLGDRITDRMRSRLHEMSRLVEMDGIDFRTGPKSVTQRMRNQIPSEGSLQKLRRTNQG
jgi:DNA replication protein DnaC